MGSEKRKFWLYISPFIFGFTVFIGGPMIASMYLSFTRYDVLTPAEWIGFDNYIRLFSNERFWDVLSNTFFYVFVGVPLHVILGLAISVLLLRAIPGISFFRTAFYLPSIFGGVAILLLWNYMLAPGFGGQNVGLINGLLSMIGIEGPGWSSDSNWAKPAVILVKLWGVGGSILILLPALAGVSKDLLEAADIDGASSFRKFFSVTFPTISPAVFFITTMEIINTFKMFIEPMIIPGLDKSWTDTLMVHLYNNAFEYFRMGYASALAWVMFFVIMVFTLINLYFAKKWVYYESK
ncbi:spermidine/putrescine ABC transporter permease [Salipaludibacillus neizhouensis]|uniref:Spermidine/putrescine ABC transporter permease n=1 Tax=Salipaludibacillus neizhouensis TaxID=885475 RepID=A0A3A9K7Y8_9BACI|nr:sugar ABC transporter permease [Salipaludibacillus neizhouensis]RKL66940.1 spermidine/putrescine ABC transporter permease [Salipaludibacillus neizhouensis]